MSSYPIVKTSVKIMSLNVSWKIDGQILLYTERQKVLTFESCLNNIWVLYTVFEETL